VRLTEQRSRAPQEWRAELALTAQGGAAVVAELEALVREHPVREESWRLLALALYDAGRQGDALAALRRSREVLTDELG
jgi:DNA-binding SARP family transcriptional activator